MKMHLTDEQLCAYLDNELDNATREAVSRALAQDPAIRARLESWSAQTEDLRMALDTELHEPLPAGLVRLASAPAATPVAVKQTASASWRDRLAEWLPSPRFAGALAAAVLVGIFIGKDLLPRLDTDGQLVRLASVAHHVYSPDKRQPVEVKSEDPTLTSWISKRLGKKVFAPQVGGFRFLGGRLLAGAEEPAGQFMYEDPSGKRLTVFVRTEGALNRSTKPECDTYRNIGVCYWYAGDVAYALAGEVSVSALASLAAPAAESVRNPKP
jgi:anti-sigma factor RsiW